MGLLRTLALLPVKGPLDGAGWVFHKIHEAAEREWHDPAAIRAQLRALEAQLLEGEITEEAYDAAEEVLLDRLREAG